MKYYGYAKSKDIFFPAAEAREEGDELYVLGFENERGYLIYKDRVQELPLFNGSLIESGVEDWDWREIENPFKPDLEEIKTLLQEVLEKFDDSWFEHDDSWFEHDKYYPTELVNKIQKAILGL